MVGTGQEQIRLVNADPARRDETGQLLDADGATTPTATALNAETTVTAVLPMRLNEAALSSLVILRNDETAPSIIPQAPVAIITVNSSDDTNVRDNVLTLREAILLANGGTSANGGLSKAELTPAEQAQVQGTPSGNQLDEVRFNIAVSSFVRVDNGENPMSTDVAESQILSQDQFANRTEQPIEFERPRSRDILSPAGLSDPRWFLESRLGASPKLNREAAIRFRARLPRQRWTRGSVDDLLWFKSGIQLAPSYRDPGSRFTLAPDAPGFPALAPLSTLTQKPEADNALTGQLSLSSPQVTSSISPDAFSCSIPAVGPLNTIVLGNGGIDPYSVAVADFNGDGKLDVVTANQASDNITVRLGNGAGGFGAPNNVSLGSGSIGPLSVAVGDLNGDGRPDVVTANGISASISVLLGNGAGGFGAPTTISLGTGANNPGSVVLSDLNGDGRLDVVTANRLSNNITVLLGNGSGSFGIPNSLSLGTSANFPFAIAIGDFNLDGKPDVVTANNNTNSMTLFFGNGAGGFGVPSTFNLGGSLGNPYSVAVGDLNGDGKPDMVLADASSLATIKVLLGSGTGDFGAPTTFELGGSNNPFSVAIGDFNGDSKPDVVAASFSDVILLLGNGAGGFGLPNTFNIGVNVADPFSLAIGDFNGDGKRDVVTANSSANNFSLLLGNGTGGFGIPDTFNLGVAANFPISGASGDFNGDGKADVVTANFGSSNISVLLANASGGFGAPNTISLADASGPRGVAVADFNRDGKLDIVTANADSQSVAVVLGDGFGGFGIAHTFRLGSDSGPVGADSIAVADFNRDGKLDVVAGLFNNLTVLLGDGAGGFGGPTTFDLGQPSFSESVAAVGDFNGDGKMDVVTANRQTNSITVLLGNGAGGFGAPNSISLGAGTSDPVSVAVADFNGDGKSDLITTNFNSDNLSLLFGNGFGGFSAPNSISIGVDASHPEFVTVSDVNGDGRLDLVTSNLYSSNMSLFLGNGNGTFGAPKTFSLGGDSLPYFIAVGDFNADGRPDFFTAAPEASSVAFLLNTCGATGVAPDLALRKTHLGNFTVGTEGFFSMTVTNVGTVSTLGGMTLTDNLPTGLSFTGWSYYPLDGRWSCSSSGQNVTCTNPLLLPPNTTSSVNLFVNVNQSAVPGFNNRAFVTTPGDANPGSDFSDDGGPVGVPCASQAINIGQTINGALTTSDCFSPFSPNSPYADHYTFTGAAGQPIAISLSSTAFDTFLYLIGPNGAVIGSDDDGGGGTNSRILAGSGFFILPSSGTYTIEVTSARTNETGNYTLSLTTGTPTCTFNIAPTAQAFSGAGGTATVSVTTPSNCQWTAVSNSSFITVNSGASGSGNGFVGFTVAANATSSPRTGTLTIAGQTFTVSQAAASGCVYNISPTSQSFTAVGGSGSASVVTPSGCAWTATSNSSFIIVNGGSGNGNGFANFTVTANTSLTTRTGTLTIAGQTFTVVQGGTSTNSFTINLVSPLPKIIDPIIIDGATQPGFSGEPLIVINGTGLGSSSGGNAGLEITAGNSTVRSLTITGFGSNNRDAAILLVTNGTNVVEGCYFGTDAKGVRSSGQSGGTIPRASGVFLRSSSNNLIGGNTVAARNLISGIDGDGIIITGGSTRNSIQGNYIGTDITGNVSLGFQQIGVHIQGANGNVIGGQTATPGTPPGNLISGNIYYGVFLEDDARNNVIIGNLIGSNGVGTSAVPNKNAGVFISNPNGAGAQLSNTIGGTTTTARNIISGNSPYAVVLGVGATSTLVQGNYIGTRIDGSTALPNTYGITATQATGSTIGGAFDVARNVISGNNLTGVTIGFLNSGQLGGTGTTIQRNYIGTNFNATGPLPNQADGVFVEVESITHTVQENVIAFNGSNGVRIPNVTDNAGTPGVRIQIVDNSIFSNAALGIDLGSAGITQNDPLDADVGANLQQNFPVLESVSGLAASGANKSRDVDPDATVTVKGKLSSAPNTVYTVHWYFSADAQCVSNQQTSRPLVTGKVPEVTTNDQGDAPFSFPLDLPVGINNGIVNCTATDPVGNTSEFSACLLVNAAQPPPPTPTPIPSPAVQWDASSYSAAENIGSKTLTVTRTGNSSAAATVNYTTGDTAGLNSCSQVNTGKASSRCDYETTMGTLSFAAGETAKTISIPIVDDAYAEGSESFTVTLSSPTSVTLGSPSTATVTITDNESTTGANPIDQAGFFTRLHYVDFLNREPDASGLGFWTNQITSCGTDQACIELKRINVSAAFYVSIEFQDTGYLVERIYRVAYGNAVGTSTLGGTHQLPVPVIRLNEFLPDTQQIGQGIVVGQSGWEAKLESNKQAFMNEFVQRTRFTTAYPGTLTAAQFVDALNSNAGNALSVTERNQLVSDLATNAKTRAQVLRAVAEDPDLNAAEFNRAFVLMQFFGYLRRNPNDPQDTDYTGYDFWLGKLNQFGGNYVNAEMVKAFIASGEYKGRFGP